MVGEKMWVNGSKMGQNVPNFNDIIAFFTKIVAKWPSLWLYGDVNVPKVARNAEK